MSSLIDEQTKIPLHWVFGILASVGSVLAVGITISLYVSRIEAKADSANQIIQEQKKEIESISKAWQNVLSDQLNYLRSIDQRLSRMEGQFNGGKKNGN